MGFGPRPAIGCCLMAKATWPLCRSLLCVSREGFWSTGAGHHLGTAAGQLWKVGQCAYGLASPLIPRPQRPAIKHGYQVPPK